MSIVSFVKRHPVLAAAYYLYDDWYAGWRWKRGKVETASGSRHAKLQLEESLEYIERVTRDYISYAAGKEFSGSIAEIGPGDNFGVAALLLNQGATAVHAIDKFHSHRNAERQTAIYRALAQRHNLGHLFNGLPEEKTLRGVIYHPGCPAEVFFRSSGLYFDAIISRAVLEHLTDPLGALNDMVRSLRPGGFMVHRIDFRDHGMFAGAHPLTFLMFSSSLWRRMTRYSGRPNRILFPAWESWLAKSGLKGSLKISRLVGIEEELEPASWPEIPLPLRTIALDTVRTLKSKCASTFKNMKDQDLAIAGCILKVEGPS